MLMHATPWLIMGRSAPLGVNSGSPAFWRPINFGTEGPKTSRSSSPTLRRRRRLLLVLFESSLDDEVDEDDSAYESATAKLAETVLLPTPPLPDDTTSTRFTFGMRRFSGGPVPRRGILGGRRSVFFGRPCSAHAVVVARDRQHLRAPTRSELESGAPVGFRVSWPELRSIDWRLSRSISPYCALPVWRRRRRLCSLRRRSRYRAG